MAEDEKAEDLIRNLTSVEKEEYRDAFKLFDKDGDGVITVDEIYQVFKDLGFNKYSKKDVKNMVKAVDIDGNGTIDLDEFIVLIKKQDKSDNKYKTIDEELKQAFKIFDTDGNGEIDAEELSTIMTALGEKLSKQDIEFMIRSVDLDAGGTIDFKEFRKMMHLAPIEQDTISKIKQ